MILQALVDYYSRKRAFDPASIAPAGWEYREIAFFIDLGADGVAHLVDRRSIERKRGEQVLVPAAEIRSGTKAYKKPNLLWDHMGFVLGWQKQGPDGSPDPSDKPEKVAKQHKAFRERIRSLLTRHPNSPGLRAIQDFYDSSSMDDIQPTTLRNALQNGQGLNVTFRIQGQIDPICHENWVSSECAIADSERDVEDDSDGLAMRGRCLVTGSIGPIARLHPKISFVTSKPSPFVAANTNEAPAYSSYGKEQGFNAPVSVEAAAQYSLALNTLLKRDSPNKVQIADTTVVIWADRNDSVEHEIVALFGDDPDASIETVKNRLGGATDGTMGSAQSETAFFVLGLAPNASRIAVRYWIHDSLERLGPRILQHFDDLRIVRGSDQDPATPAFKWLLRSIAPQGEDKNIPARLAGEWLRTILEGTPYPPPLLNAVINRCRAERPKQHSRFGKTQLKVSYLRAAILKACVNREYRRRNGLPPSFQFIREDLDVSQTDRAYRLGRLFAVLEIIQSAAQPEVNATIRDRYYGAASSAPSSVFPTLLRLKNAHLKKLNPSSATFFEKQLGDIFGCIEQPALTTFPRHLDFPAQGLFALGYYHQRQSLYSGKPSGEPDNLQHSDQES